MMYFKFILASQILNLATLLAVGQTRSCTFEPHPKSVSNGVSDSHDKVVSHRTDDTAHYQVDATYSQSDISRINSLLREASQLKEKPKSWMLWFGKKFIGVPYVGGTLDRAEEEKLVINTSELDCTTFVEIVTALTRCMSGNGKRISQIFADSFSMSVISMEKLPMKRDSIILLFGLVIMQRKALLLIFRTILLSPKFSMFL